MTHTVNIVYDFGTWLLEAYNHKEVNVVYLSLSLSMQETDKCFPKIEASHSQQYMLRTWRECQESCLEQ